VFLGVSLQIHENQCAGDEIYELDVVYDQNVSVYKRLLDMPKRSANLQFNAVNEFILLIEHWLEYLK